MNNKTWHLSNTVISKQTYIDNNWKRQTIPSIDCRNRWIWTLSKGEKHHHLRLKNKRNWHLFPENVQLGKTLENKKWNHYKSRWSETKTGGCTMIYTAIIIWLVTHWKLQFVTNLKLSSHDLIACRCFSVWKFDQREPTELHPFADVPVRNVRSSYDLRHPGQKSVPANASANQPPSCRGWYDLGFAKARFENSLHCCTTQSRWVCSRGLDTMALILQHREAWKNPTSSCQGNHQSSSIHANRGCPVWSWPSPARTSV